MRTPAFAWRDGFFGVAGQARIEVVPGRAHWLDEGMKVTWRNATLAVLLGAQVIGIAAARFGPERYFCWAPYDEITKFEIAVTIDGRQLSTAEIQSRYRLPDPARDNRSYANVISLIARYEQTYGAADHARVKFHYRVNGGAPRQWQWPLRADAGPDAP
jgi:hypothetical protein